MTSASRSNFRSLMGPNLHGAASRALVLRWPWHAQVPRLAGSFSRHRPTAIAADGEKKAFALPDNSKLELSIPAGWKDEVKTTQGPKANQGSAPPTVALTPREGAPFEVRVTPVARQRQGASADTAIKMRHSVQQGGGQGKAERDGALLAGGTNSPARPGRGTTSPRPTASRSPASSST